MDNELIIEKIMAGQSDLSATAQADALIESIDKSIDNFTADAIKAGREYSNYTMNQCVAVSISGASLFGELKTIAIFALLIYVALMTISISKKFPKLKSKNI
jgi:hypothetical protein